MSKEAKWQEVYKVQTAAITELEQRIAELEAERDAAFNKGMERAAEIVRAERNDLASPSYNDALDVVGELIRKEIDK